MSDPNPYLEYIRQDYLENENSANPLSFAELEKSAKFKERYRAIANRILSEPIDAYSERQRIAAAGVVARGVWYPDSRTTKGDMMALAMEFCTHSPDTPLMCSTDDEARSVYRSWNPNQASDTLMSFVEHAKVYRERKSEANTDMDDEKTSELIKAVLAPILKMEDTKLVAISTPEGEPEDYNVEPQSSDTARQSIDDELDIIYNEFIQNINSQQPLSFAEFAKSARLKERYRTITERILNTPSEAFSRIQQINAAGVLDDVTHPNDYPVTFEQLMSRDRHLRSTLTESQVSDTAAAEPTESQKEKIQKLVDQFHDTVNLTSVAPAVPLPNPLETVGWMVYYDSPDGSKERSLSGEGTLHTGPRSSCPTGSKCEPLAYWRQLEQQTSNPNKTTEKLDFAEFAGISDLAERYDAVGKRIVLEGDSVAHPDLEFWRKYVRVVLTEKLSIEGDLELIVKEFMRNQASALPRSFIVLEQCAQFTERYVAIAQRILDTPSGTFTELQRRFAQSIVDFRKEHPDHRVYFDFLLSQYQNHFGAAHKEVMASTAQGGALYRDWYTHFKLENGLTFDEYVLATSPNHRPLTDTLPPKVGKCRSCKSTSPNPFRLGACGGTRLGTVCGELVCEECVHRGGIECAHCPALRCPRCSEEFRINECQTCCNPVCRKCDEATTEVPPCAIAEYYCICCKLSQARRVNMYKHCARCADWHAAMDENYGKLTD